MGFILREVTITGTRRRRTVPSLFDSGAYRNYVRRVLDDGETVDDIGFHVFEGPHDAVLADGSRASGERVRFRELHIGTRRLPDVRFVVLPDLTKEAIIGAETMQELHLRLDPPREQLLF